MSVAESLSFQTVVHRFISSFQPKTHGPLVFGVASFALAAFFYIRNRSAHLELAQLQATVKQQQTDLFNLNNVKIDLYCHVEARKTDLQKLQTAKAEAQTVFEDKLGSFERKLTDLKTELETQVQLILDENKAEAQKESEYADELEKKLTALDPNWNQIEGHPHEHPHNKTDSESTTTPTLIHSDERAVVRTNAKSILAELEGETRNVEGRSKYVILDHLTTLKALLELNEPQVDGE